MKRINCPTFLQRLLLIACFIGLHSVVAWAVSTSFTTTSALVERNNSAYYSTSAPSLFSSPTVQGGLGNELTEIYSSEMFYNVSSVNTSTYSILSGGTSSYNSSSSNSSSGSASSSYSSSPRRVGTVQTVTRAPSTPGTPGNAGTWPGTPGDTNTEGKPIWLPIGDGLFPLLLLALLSIGIVTIRKRKSA